jgi:hypothetical protein
MSIFDNSPVGLWVSVNCVPNRPRIACNRHGIRPTQGSDYPALIKFSEYEIW